LQIKTKIVSNHTADSKPVKQEVNGTVILPPLVSLFTLSLRLWLPCTSPKKAKTSTVQRAFLRKTSPT
jgi:hypothetical protein